MTTKGLQITLIRISFCLLSLVFFACTENKTLDNPEILISVSKDSLFHNKNLGTVFYQDNPFTGVSQVFSNSNQLTQTTEFLEGKKDGSLKKWYANGTLSYEANYIAGKKHGSSKSWWNDSKLRSESNFFEGKVDGGQKQWYSNGNIFKEMNFDKGKEAGMQKAYRKNGKIYCNYEAINGRFFGLKRAHLCYELSEEIVQNDK